MKAEQQALFVPTESGEQPAERVQVRLLHRTDDPETSKRAARRIYRAGKPPWHLPMFLGLLTEHGPLTVNEAAAYCGEREQYFRFEFNRRVKAWSVAGFIELTGEVRDGGRVWRVAETAK